MNMYKKPTSCLCTQASMETPGYKELCLELLKEEPSFHRKQWEFAYILDMLRQHNKLKSGSKGLGFGCGKERLVPALLSQGCDILATDLDFDEAAEKGWVATNQHAKNIDGFREYIPSVCSEDDLARLSYRNVDMNKIPHELMQMQYDFVWSSCSLEHVGNMDEAKRFILSSVHCLKPGGIAVHTTEYNLSSNDQTLLSGPTVLFRAKDIEDVVQEAEKIDGITYTVNLNPGIKRLDKYIDMPPYLGSARREHLKLQIEQWTCTSIGLCIRRKD